MWTSGSGVAADAGMSYAVLTAKHVSGHCLWPSDETDYHVGTSSNRTDVVEAFVTACKKHGVRPGLYYCSWDNHHLLGSRTLNMGHAFTTRAYRDFQLRQTRELLTRYGELEEVWIDIPWVLDHEGRRQQYDLIAELQPNAVVMMNHSFGDGSELNYDKVWPTDLMAIERWLPHSHHGYEPWHAISHGTKLIPGEVAGKHQYIPDPPQDYYIPGEVCDPIGYEWFFQENDGLRSVEELLGMRLLCRERHVNLLLDVPPDRRGLIPEPTVERLIELRRAYEQVYGR